MNSTVVKEKKSITLNLTFNAGRTFQKNLVAIELLRKRTHEELERNNLKYKSVVDYVTTITAIDKAFKKIQEKTRTENGGEIASDFINTLDHSTSKHFDLLTKMLKLQQEEESLEKERQNIQAELEEARRLKKENELRDQMLEATKEERHKLVLE